MKTPKILLIGTLIAAVLALSLFMPQGHRSVNATTPFYCHGSAFDRKQDGYPNYHWDAYGQCDKNGIGFLVDELYLIVAAQHYNWSTGYWETTGVVGGNLCNSCYITFASGDANYGAQGGFNCRRIDNFFHATKDGNGYGNHVYSNAKCY